MKRVKKMKIRNKGILLIAVSICLMVGFTHISQVSAAQDDEEDSFATFLDPFTLTMYDLTADMNLRYSGGDMGTTSSVVPLSTVNPLSLESISRPIMIWIPQRPTFRSPCIPSW
jgi:hypothetical protein